MLTLVFWGHQPQPLLSINFSGTAVQPIHQILGEVQSVIAKSTSPQDAIARVENLELDKQAGVESVDIVGPFNELICDGRYHKLCAESGSKPTIVHA